MDDIHDRFGQLLDSLDLVWLDPELFSQAIHAKGAPLQQNWGFIDGTPRPMARPTRNQRIMYSGHKRTHCLKFQVSPVFFNIIMGSMEKFVCISILPVAYICKTGGQGA